MNVKKEASAAQQAVNSSLRASLKLVNKLAEKPEQNRVQLARACEALQRQVGAVYDLGEVAKGEPVTM